MPLLPPMKLCNYGEKMKIQNVTELFGLDDREFISSAFENLIGRKPDDQGMRYYLGRLALGNSRQSVILQLAKSDEALGGSTIHGLNKLIKQEQFNQSVLGRFLLLFTKKTNQSLRPNALSLNNISEQLERSASLQTAEIESFVRWGSAFETIANRTGTAIESTQATHVSKMQSLSLSQSEVTRAFREILGRSPESAQVIRAHQDYASLEALLQYLRQTPECQSRTASLSAPAKRAYHLLRAALPVTSLES